MEKGREWEKEKEVRVGERGKWGEGSKIEKTGRTSGGKGREKGKREGQGEREVKGVLGRKSKRENWRRAKEREGKWNGIKEKGIREEIQDKWAGRLDFLPHKLMGRKINLGKGKVKGKSDEKKIKLGRKKTKNYIQSFLFG